MPKTKERETDKSSKSSSRASAKTSAKSPAKNSTRANGVSAQAKPASKSSTKVPAVTTKPSSGSIAKAAPQTKPASGSHSKSAPAASKATAPVAIAKPTSSKSSAKIAVPVKPRSDRLEKVLEKPVANLKAPFTKEELRGWREQLLQRRNEISSDIAGLEKDAMEAEDGHTTPNHIAERGSDADLQDVSLGIAGEEKDIIWQIDRALRKIDEASPLPFGLCEFTKEPISRNRLQLIPWTPLSIEGANYMEENNLKVEDLLVDG